MISAIEEGAFDDAQLAALRKEWQVKAGKVPVIGITGTGGAGKSSVTDEMLNRFLAMLPRYAHRRAGSRSDAPSHRWRVAR